MGALDLVWHLGNLFAVAVLFGLVASAGAKLIWRRSLGAIAWKHLALGVCAAAMVVTLAGLLVFGRDGRMATYALMVVAGAAVLAWARFRRAGQRGPGQRPASRRAANAAAPR